MRMTLRVVLAVLFAALPIPAFAQNTDDATIDDLAWIAGTWATDLADQALEERWSPPMDNAMAGSFRWSRDGEVWLYEFLVIEETDEGIFYYLRHFGPGSVGWEDRDAPLAYRLESLTSNRAEFTSLTGQGDSFIFDREGDELTIEIVSADDSRRFVYDLQSGAPENADEAATEDEAGTEEAAVDPASPEDGAAESAEGAQPSLDTTGE